MDKMRMETPNLTAANIEKIGELFPNCITETVDEHGNLKKAVNFDLLRQILSDTVVGGGCESYEFTWVGKKASIAEANRPIRKTLRLCPEDSVNWDTTKNLYIEGDNLDVLKLLQESYLGKVKMIYIDPPYNTGNDFIYRDDFAVSADDYAEESGQLDEDGNRLFKNTDSNGRFHSDWCSMIYSRLMLARNLLSDDGVIFISIDDNEQKNLKNICDEVFGESNFVAELIWEQGRKSMAAQVAINHEYCYIYCKDKANNIFVDSAIKNTNWKEKKQGLEEIYAEYDRLKSKYGNDYLSIEKGIRSFYKNLPDDNPSKRQSQYKCVDEKGLYFPGDIAQGTGNGGRFDILHPITKRPCKLPKGGWRFGEDKLPSLLKENRIHFGEDETKVPCLKRYLRETEYEVVSSVFYKDGRGASKRLEQLFGGKVFDFPKDEDIMKKFVSLVTSYKDSDSLVLDFFSGSASTAHAVMQLNAEDGGHRKFIMVQLPEETAEDSEAYNAGYKNICEIGKERIRRAGAKIKSETGADIDYGFRVFKLASSNMNDVYYSAGEYSQDLLSAMESNIKADRTDLDLLFGCLLEWGLPLSMPYKSEKINGCTVHNYNDGDLIACFDKAIPESVIKTIAKRQPLRVVFRDDSFADSPSKINVGEIFKMLAPDTRVKVI